MIEIQNSRTRLEVELPSTDLLIENLNTMMGTKDSFEDLWDLQRN